MPPGYIYQLGYATGGFGWASMILPQMEQPGLFNSINFSPPAWTSPNSTACTTRVSTYRCPTDFTADLPPGSLVREGFSYARSSYVANFGPNDLDITPEDRAGAFSRNSGTRFADVIDGLSQTLLGGERTNAVFLTVVGSADHFDLETVWPGAIKQDPADDHGHTALFQSAYFINSPNFDDRNAMSYHPGGLNFLMGDGSVRFLKLSIDLSIYRALGTRAGGEVIGADRY